MKKVITIIFLVALLIPIPAIPGQIYIWVDDQGVRHITDKPPERPTEMIGTVPNKQASPEEIQRFEAERRAERNRLDSERQQQQILDAYRTRERQYEMGMEKIEKEIEKSAIERARENLKAAEERREELADDYRGTYSSWGRDFYQDRMKKQDKEIDKRRRELMELENK